MTMPNFFIIGAQKAGTTSLYHYLKQHPDVYLSPVKEPFFFNHELGPDGEVLKEKFGGPGRPRKPRFASLDEYRALFAGARSETAIGEASVLYICVPGTAERIERYAPGSRVIALLRDPAERAYSAFLNAVRGGREPLRDFSAALREEECRIRENWAHVFRYRTRGLYYTQLKRYYEVFGAERIGVWLYEDLREDPVGVAQGVFRFLGVDDAFVPDASRRHNPASVPRSEFARRAIRFVNTKSPLDVKKLIPPSSRAHRILQSTILTAQPPPLDAETRAWLVEGYREDVLRLEELIGRDLSTWLRTGT